MPCDQAGTPALTARPVMIAIVGLFLLYVWPTRFRYDHMTVDGNLVPLRVQLPVIRQHEMGGLAEKEIALHRYL